jgi:hypothetical protein
VRWRHASGDEGDHCRVHEVTTQVMENSANAAETTMKVASPIDRLREFARPLRETVSALSVSPAAGQLGNRSLSLSWSLPTTVSATQVVTSPTARNANTLPEAASPGARIKHQTSVGGPGQEVCQAVLIDIT